MYETHDKKALLLPNVTPADAGKVLAVDENGKLSLEDIGSGLPEVSSSDAGMVLTVSEDGEWEAAAPSGGGGDVMTVIISDGASSVSESIEDIILAISSGKSVIAIYDDSYTCLLSYDNTINGVSGVALESFDSGTVGCYVIQGYNDGSSDVWNVSDYSYSSGGLSLYGPYFAKNNSQASVGTNGELIQLDKIFDMDDNELRPNNDAVYLLQSFGGSTGINIQNASVYAIFATSLTGSTVTVGQFDCVVGFYSTIELQPVSQGE